MNVFEKLSKFKLYVFLCTVLLTSVGLKAQTVTLDYYFNHETKLIDGKQERWHYLWEEKGNNGFSIWGDYFIKHGGKLKSLDARPTASTLKNTEIYIIVDPDSKKENPNPNYIENQDVKEITNWVKKGGVLVLMANDSANVGLTHFNPLAEQFGIHFNNDIQLHVIDDAHFDDGSIAIKDHSIFKTSKKVFLKDACGITLTGTAKASLTAANGAAIAAVSKYGKGMVFAVGDPWLYNEYVNGRLPADFENDKAAEDLAKWLIDQTI
jgi:hypothetical protein